MTNTPDTPRQLSDLIRSVEARITTLQHERQALVTQLQDIRRTRSAGCGYWSAAPRPTFRAARPPRSRPRTKDAIATAAKRRWAAQRDEGA